MAQDNERLNIPKCQGASNMSIIEVVFMRQIFLIKRRVEDPQVDFYALGNYLQYLTYTDSLIPPPSGVGNTRTQIMMTCYTRCPK